MTILGLNCGETWALGSALERYQDLFAVADVIGAAESVLFHLRGRLNARLLPLSLPVRDWLADLGTQARVGKRILLLADGDPLFFGLGSTLADMRPDWETRFIPAITCMQEACARLGLPWANLTVVSLHGRENLQPLFEALNQKKDFCLLCGTGPGPDYVARLIRDRSCLDYRVHIFRRLGHKDEESQAMCLETCAVTHFPANTLSIFRRIDAGDFKGVSDTGLLGDYSTAKMVRGAVLQLLDIQASDIVWDIGAGSGRMGFDMASRASQGKVYSIERQSARLMDIQYNRQRVDCFNLEIINGHAPDALERLPAPAAIFIGGGLSSSEELLETCAKRLLPGGRMVAACILLETLYKCMNWDWANGFGTSFVELQIGRSSELGCGTRLVPENPVFLFRALKKDK